MRWGFNFVLFISTNINQSPRGHLLSISSFFIDLHCHFYYQIKSGTWKIVLKLSVLLHRLCDDYCDINHINLYCNIYVLCCFNLCNIGAHFNICIQCTSNRFQFHLLLALVPIHSSRGIWKSRCQSLPLSLRSKDTHNKIKVFVWPMFIRLLSSPYICLERMTLLDARLPIVLWSDSISEPLSGLYPPFMSFLHTVLRICS